MDFMNSKINSGLLTILLGLVSWNLYTTHALTVQIQGMTQDAFWINQRNDKRDNELDEFRLRLSTIEKDVLELKIRFEQYLKK